jgi:uncharacterized protein (DUF2126 family)
MLPHFLWQDLMEVVTELGEAGLPLRGDWFLPFLEFRFPQMGEVRLDGVDIELRTAIEPWYVLGEETTSRGTARFVDSSVERLQVKLSGWTEERYVLVCNGRRVPLRPTGTRGEFVAGVRYRAWQPPSSLHPTIGVHAPLSFDVFDTWNGRSVGGCTYHVMHEGGRHYETVPVNAFEAEARRVARFYEWGHTPPPDPGRIALQAMTTVRSFIPAPAAPLADLPPEEAPPPEFPHTLDLRRPPKLV